MNILTPRNCRLEEDEFSEMLVPSQFKKPFEVTGYEGTRQNLRESEQGQRGDAARAVGLRGPLNGLQLHDH